jgi:hypothetical protein
VTGLIDLVVRRQVVARRETRAGAAQNRERYSGIAVGRFQHLEDLAAQPLFSALRFSGRFNVMRRTRGRGSSTTMC